VETFQKTFEGKAETPPKLGITANETEELRYRTVFVNFCVILWFRNLKGTGSVFRKI
jgi:hypothetical protein